MFSEPTKNTKNHHYFNEKMLKTYQHGTFSGLLQMYVNIWFGLITNIHFAHPLCCII